MIRPVLHVRDLQISILEYEDELKPTIEDTFLQGLELDLLMRLYEWKHLRLDRVVEPIIKCNCVISDTRFGLKYDVGIKKDHSQSKVINRTIHFEPMLFEIEDLEKIQEYDEETTMRRLSLMKEIFDGILEVKLSGINRFNHAPWDNLLAWIGMNEGMYKFATDPDFMHAAIQRYLQMMTIHTKKYEEMGLLSSNNCFENIGYNGIGYTSQLPEPTESGIGAKLKDIWGANADQIMTSVSPAMSEEFAFEYESRYASLFGLYSYGCCERLDHKVKELRANFSNLRKVSMSPFSNIEEGMEALGSDYVVCFKPNSNYLVGDSYDLDYLKKELLDVCALVKKYDSNLVINMKTIITLSGDPTRLWRWCTMAEDIIASF